MQDVSQFLQDDKSLPSVDNYLSANNSLPSVDEYLSSKPKSSDPWESFKSRATEIANQKGFPSNVLLGQAALESHRGTSNFARNRNNYFGYQAYDSNPDAAKHYDTPDQSINDYINLVMSYPGVPQAVASGDSSQVIQAIKNAGYATDPNYVMKVMNTAEFKGQ